MKIWIVAAILAMSVCAVTAYAADKDAKVSSGDFGTETVGTVADTAQSAVIGTANIVQTSLSDTVDTPGVAIQAVMDTANKAFNGTDTALRALTGDDS